MPEVFLILSDMSLSTRFTVRLIIIALVFPCSKQNTLAVRSSFTEVASRPDVLYPARNVPIFGVIIARPIPKQNFSFIKLCTVLSGDDEIVCYTTKL